MPFARSHAADRAAPVAPSQTPDTVAGLVNALARAGQPAQRLQLVNALVALDSPEAAAALADLLGHAEPAVRASGIDGLRRISPAIARPAVKKLLANPAADIRIRALDAVERIPDAEIEGWLIDLLEREDVANVCAVVLDLLTEMGTPAALPAIRAARVRFANQPFIAFAADFAIAQILGA